MSDHLVLGQWLSCVFHYTSYYKVKGFEKRYGDFFQCFAPRRDEAVIFIVSLEPLCAWIGDII